METYHIRKGVRRSGRRVTDRGSAGETLCGAPLTCYDVTVAQARKIVYAGTHAAGFARCEVCFGRLLSMDFARTARVED